MKILAKFLLSSVFVFLPAVVCAQGPCGWASSATDIFGRVSPEKVDRLVDNQNCLNDNLGKLKDKLDNLQSRCQKLEDNLKQMQEDIQFLPTMTDLDKKISPDDLRSPLYPM